MDFVTLGMAIIDEIHFQGTRPPALDVLGGAGPWAVIGARMFREAPASQKVGWILHKGSDFPTPIESAIDAWETGCHKADTPERLTTRGWNQYGNDEKRAFKYLTPKLRIDQYQLTEPMLLARCFHLICTPTRCMNLVNGILEKRKTLSQPSTTRPWFVWEPVPDSCGTDELENVLQALELVNVVSPNHQELGALFDVTNDLRSDNGMEQIDKQSAVLLKGFGNRPGVVVVRCGERGCRVVSENGTIMMPAYHQEPSKVIDPTGAGNAFLGAFCIGLLDAPDAENPFEAAAKFGSLAAGCAIEQIGLPTLEYRDGKELWNGISMADRIAVYRQAAGSS